MISVVIADDEKLIRAGISKILTDQLDEPINILEAKNGEEAYSFVVNEHAEIVITDIRMPILDGVGLMKKLNKLDVKPSVIVLSGFDEFNYAKAAIENGAISYLLKPVDSYELLTVVNTAIIAAKKAGKAKDELALNSIINEGYSEKSISLDKKNFPNGFCSVGITGKDCGEKVLSGLKSEMYCVVQQKKDFLNLVVSKESLYLLRSDLNLSNYVIGISSPSERVGELRRLNREAVSAMFQSFFVGDNREGDILKRKKRCGIYYFTYENAMNDFSAIDAKYDRIIAAIDLMNIEDARKGVYSLFDFSGIEAFYRGECLRYIYSNIVNNLLKRYPKIIDSDTYLYLKSIMIENIQQVSCLYEWVHYVSDYVIYLVELLKRKHGKYPYISKALEYIDKHYAEDISMVNVANYVSMNYTWFSEKFKEQVGMNFNDYLRRYRMEKAKLFLESGAFKVYEAAEKAGFKDVKHFMKTFKEMTGMTAGEWGKVHSS